MPRRLKRNKTGLMLLLLLLLLAACSNPVDPRKILGKWSIRKDSSSMNLLFTPDSLLISYWPEKSQTAYKYRWKQEDETGLIECLQEVPLHNDSMERKVLVSKLYVLKVSADSLSVWLPEKKMRFDLKREN